MPSLHRGGGSIDTKLWTFTNNFNMRDLSRDDDFLSYLLVETFGTGEMPLVVHRMDVTRKFPQFDCEEVLQIVKKWLLFSKLSPAKSIRKAVDALLFLPAVRYYCRRLSQSQLNAFATHTARYLEIYLPTSVTEIAHTSRYSHRTGKAELCILATHHLLVGAVLTELKGSMAVLTDAENEELKCTGRTQGARRDFSVIHSGHRKKNHLFLGPARFVNHDCENNCELVREGKYITFRVIKSILPGQEITAHYGDSYFGKGNRFCLCETCERLGQGGYREDPYTDSDHDSDSDVSIASPISARDTSEKPHTRRNAQRSPPTIPPQEVHGSEEGRGVIQLEEATTEEAVILTPVSPSPSSSALDQRTLSRVNGFHRLDTSPSLATSDIIDLTSRPPSALASITSCTANSTTSLASLPTSGRQTLSPPGSSIHSIHEDATSRPSLEFRISSTDTSVRDSPTSVRLSISSRASTASLSPSGRARPLAFEGVRNEPAQLRKSSRLASRIPDQQASCSITNIIDHKPSSLLPEPNIQVKREDENVDQSLVSRVTRSSLRTNSHGSLTLSITNKGQPTNPLDSLSSRNVGLNPQRVVSTSTSKRRGRPPKQPKTCNICNCVLTQAECGSARVNDRVECVRCKRHSTIFSAPWPSRIPLWIPPFPSPSPEPVARDRQGVKRHLEVDHSAERSPKRHRWDTGWEENVAFNRRRLSKQDLRRQRRNERRRLARARAREGRIGAVEVYCSSSKPRSIVEIDKDEENSSDEEETITLKSVIHSWEDNGITLLDRTPQFGRCVSLCKMKQTPDVLAKRFWMKLSQSTRTEGLENITVASLEDSRFSNSPTSSTPEECIELIKVSSGSRVDARPSGYARRRMSWCSRFSNDTPREMDDSKGHSYCGSEVKVKYRTGTSHKPVRTKHKSSLLPAMESVRTPFTQQSTALIDQTLGQFPPQLGQITYGDEAIYEAAEDRLPTCIDHTVRHLSGSNERIPDPSAWSFHIPYLPLATHLKPDNYPMKDEGVCEEEVCSYQKTGTPGSRAKDSGVILKRSSLTIQRAVNPPWCQGTEHEASLVNPPVKSVSADLSEPNLGCEYPRLGSPLQFRSSLELTQKQSIELELKCACWSE